MKKKTTKQRLVLVILTNRFNRNQKPKFIEVACKSDGTILEERTLRREPTEPRYDEVWANDDGKTSLATCTRVSRRYGHPLQQPKA